MRNREYDMHLRINEAEYRKVYSYVTVTVTSTKKDFYGVNRRERVFKPLVTLPL